jgi:ABC-type polar amino acid transport system ATPase subunit
LIVSGASRQRVRLAVARDNSLKGEALDIMSVLRAEAARGICVVVSLHDLGLAARFADRVIVLAGGRPSSTPLMASASAPSSSRACRNRWRGRGSPEP